MVVETLLYVFGAVSLLCVMWITLQVLFLTKGEPEAIPVKKDTIQNNHKKAA